MVMAGCRYRYYTIDRADATPMVTFCGTMVRRDTPVSEVFSRGTAADSR